MTEPPARGNWATARPEEAASWLTSASVPWWVAGGWALDINENAIARSLHSLPGYLFDF